MSLELSETNRLKTPVKKFGNSNLNILSFAAAKKNSTKVKLPKILYPTKPEDNPVKLDGVPLKLATEIINAANERGSTIGEVLSAYLKPIITKMEGVIPEPSVTVDVGKTKVTSLIDAKQIFNKVTEYIKSAENNIQIEMFEFQNLKIDGDLWPSNGAETIPGWSDQQKILDMLVKKKQANPKINIQVILDTHKWYQDGNGNYKRHYGNMKMIKYLKENGIDVVPYPRAIQGGSILQHVKFLAVDGKKLILGGMNWGNHSSANHDACVSIERNPKYKQSEVDNIIAEIFHKDWKFAWQRLGQTKFVPGPTKPEEQGEYKGRGKEIKAEAVEYMKLVGSIFDTPEYRERFEKGNLNLPEIKPIDDPAMKILTNSPKEYAYVGANGSESIGDYIKQKIDTCTSLKAELFVLSHKEIVNKIIKRYKEAQNGGKPFDVQILISPGILDDFPYCRKALSLLEEAGVPVRLYKINKDLQQRLHTKWALFDNKELLIGSANWSAVGLENNLATGQRTDYPLTNELLNKRIAEHKPKITELEKELGISHIFNKKSKIDYKELKVRINNIEDDISRIEVNDIDKLDTVTIDKIETFKRLLGYYHLIKIHEERKEKYKRGNHECAVVIPSEKLGAVFLRQFNKDWEYSTPVVPDGYDEAVTEKSSPVEAAPKCYADIAFAGKIQKSLVTFTEARFNKLV